MLKRSIRVGEDHSYISLFLATIEYSSCFDCSPRARGALHRTIQWDDGFTPSRGIRCQVASDALARRRWKTKMNPNGLSIGVGRVKDATIAVIRGGRIAASAATQHGRVGRRRKRKTQEEDTTRLIDRTHHDTLPSISTIWKQTRSSEQKWCSLEHKPLFGVTTGFFWSRHTTRSSEQTRGFYGTLNNGRLYPEIDSRRGQIIIIGQRSASSSFSFSSSAFSAFSTFSSFSL